MVPPIEGMYPGSPRPRTGDTPESGRALAPPGERRLRRSEGQAVVEFAVVLPILMLIVLGILKFGTLYTNYIQLTDAVRSGARQLAIERGQASPCVDAQNELVSSATELSASSITLSMSVDPAGSPAVVYTGGSSGCPTLVSGDAATVAASYPCDLKFMGIDFAPGCTISASATERVE